jgi:predicted nucleic acid-binding protein
VSFVNSDLHASALAALLAARRRRLSLVDCVSFETMRHLSVTRAFAFDPHFTEQGFELVQG